MFFKNAYVLTLWTKEASAFEGLNTGVYFRMAGPTEHLIQSPMYYFPINIIDLVIDNLQHVLHLSYGIMSTKLYFLKNLEKKHFSVSNFFLNILKIPQTDKALMTTGVFILSVPCCNFTSQDL